MSFSFYGYTQDQIIAMSENLLAGTEDYVELNDQVILWKEADGLVVYMDAVTNEVLGLAYSKARDSQTARAARSAKAAARLVMEVLNADKGFTEMKKCVRNLELVFPDHMTVRIHKNSRARMIIDLNRLHAKLVMTGQCGRRNY